MGNTHSHHHAMSENIKDVSMVDVSDAADESKTGSQKAIVQSFSKLDIGDHGAAPPLQRRRSTLIFDDDDDMPRHEENVGAKTDLDEDHTSQDELTGNSSESSSASVFAQQRMSPDESQGEQSSRQSSPGVIPVEITWQQGGNKVYVTGSFTGWRKMIGLAPVADRPGVFHIKLQLPTGTHRFRFIVDNELRFSDYLPTATDQMGNFVNYIEITAPETQDTLQQQEQDQAAAVHPKQKSKAAPVSARSKLALQIEGEPDDMGDGYSRFHGGVELKPHYEYTQDIPAVFTDPSVMEQYYLTLDQQQNNQQNLSWLTPPQLPPHLENVILNNYSPNAQAGDSGSENNSGALPIPNHVVLNHLATSSIKHNTLCVASIVRYKRKYVTQMLYAPLQ